MIFFIKHFSILHLVWVSATFNSLDRSTLDYQQNANILTRWYRVLVAISLFRLLVKEFL